MRAVVQRVSSASVRVDGIERGACERGLLVLLGVAAGDDAGSAYRLAEKVARLRVFDNEEGRFDRSVLDVGGGALVVTQFTLLADTRKGNRPSFTGAAPPEDGRRLFDYLLARARNLHAPVASGAFGAHMAVTLTNDGPVTIWLQASPEN